MVNRMPLLCFGMDKGVCYPSLTDSDVFFPVWISSAPWLNQCRLLRLSSFWHLYSLDQATTNVCVQFGCFSMVSYTVGFLLCSFLASEQIKYSPCFLLCFIMKLFSFSLIVCFLLFSRAFLTLIDTWDWKISYLLLDAFSPVRRLKLLSGV